MVGNKNDLYLEEAVTDEEGLKLAREIDAIYQRTSAKSDSGSIDELLKSAHLYFPKKILVTQEYLYKIYKTKLK